MIVNSELYKRIITSDYMYYRNSPEYFKKYIEENFPGKYKKILYMKDEIILRENTIDDCIYFLERGKVILTKKDIYNKQYSYGYLFPGDFFGYSSFINMPEIVSYKTLTNCYIYKIEINGIKQMMSNNENIKEQVQKLIIDNLRILTVRQGNLSAGGCRRAFANFIKEYFKDYSRFDDEGNIIVNLDVTLSEIAVILNVTRETLSRIVSEMKKDRIIETKRKYIKILDLTRFMV